MSLGSGSPACVGSGVPTDRVDDDGSGTSTYRCAACGACMGDVTLAPVHLPGKGLPASGDGPETQDDEAAQDRPEGASWRFR